MRKSKGALIILFVMAAILAGCAQRQPAPQVLAPAPAQSRGYSDAVQLRAQFRSLAEELLSRVPPDSLKNYVAMPTYFVNENNITETCPLGRLISESMFTEFSQKGYPVREYRLASNVSFRKGRNELAMVVNRSVPAKARKNAAVLLGTYQFARDATFVNARLVRASDGMVLGASELVLQNTPLVLSLLGGGTTLPVSAGSHVAPQSASVRAPSYPALGGSGYGLGGIPIVQGR